MNLKEEFEELVSLVEAGGAVDDNVSRIIEDGQSAIRSMDSTLLTVHLHEMNGLNIPEGDPYRDDRDLLEASIAGLRKVVGLEMPKKTGIESLFKSFLGMQGGTSITALRAEGDFMGNMFGNSLIFYTPVTAQSVDDGDIYVIEANDDKTNRELNAGLPLLDNGGLHTRRIFNDPDDPDAIVVVADNEKYPRLEIRRDSVRIVGKVCGALKKIDQSASGKDGERVDGGQTADCPRRQSGTYRRAKVAAEKIENNFM